MTTTLESDAATPPPTIWQTAWQGGKYAGWFVLLGAAAGALYGLLGGYVLGPALFVVAFCGVLALLNAGVALGALLLHLLLLPFGHGQRGLVQYVVMSGSFLVVYLLFFALLKLSGWQVF